VPVRHAFSLLDSIERALSAFIVSATHGLLRPHNTSKVRPQPASDSEGLDGCGGSVRQSAYYL
jgi:hypothetical protein